MKCQKPGPGVCSTESLAPDSLRTPPGRSSPFLPLSSRRKGFGKPSFLNNVLTGPSSRAALSHFIRKVCCFSTSITQRQQVGHQRKDLLRKRQKCSASACCLLLVDGHWTEGGRHTGFHWLSPPLTEQKRLLPAPLLLLLCKDSRHSCSL